MGEFNAVTLTVRFRIQPDFTFIWTRLRQFASFSRMRPHNAHGTEKDGFAMNRLFTFIAVLLFSINAGAETGIEAATDDVGDTDFTIGNAGDAEISADDDTAAEA
ncbi:MAG: hypothetical protein WBO06_14335, partial [Gammaproteobacteria bacterium]